MGGRLAPCAVSLTFCCCRFRCRDKSHKETRRVTNQRRSSEASTMPLCAHCRLQYDELRRRRMGRARERGGSNYSPIPPSPPPDYFPKIRSVAWTHKGERARVVARRMVGWFWSEMVRCASVFHPHPEGEQQLRRRRRWQRNVTKTDLLFLRPPLQPELFSGRAVRACLDPPCALNNEEGGVESVGGVRERHIR